jgi:hypothetical protein
VGHQIAPADDEQDDPDDEEQDDPPGTAHALIVPHTGVANVTAAARHAPL